MQATMLQCLHGNEAVADDGDILPFFGGPGTLLSTKAPFGKDAEQHKVDLVTFVAPDGTPDAHARNRELFSFHRGMKCATCKPLVRI